MLSTKNPFTGLAIPEPSADFEERILAAAAQRSSRAIARQQPRWRQAGMAAAMAAAISVLWIMPGGLAPREGLVRGVPLLADVTFDEEDPLALPAEDLLADLL
jgi:hypothetical protein